MIFVIQGLTLSTAWLVLSSWVTFSALNKLKTYFLKSPCQLDYYSIILDRDDRELYAIGQVQLEIFVMSLR